MPSSHSAFVTALCVSVGLRNGFNSEIFAVAFVFAAIIVYDAYRLRGTVQHHSHILRRLIRTLPENEREEVELMVGHTVPEILVGVAVGGGFAVGVFYLLKAAGV